MMKLSNRKVTTSTTTSTTTPPSRSNNKYDIGDSIIVPASQVNPSDVDQIACQRN